MANFVLVHGGWHGGWCWRAVADGLRASGHRVFTPTLTGLGERRHLISLVDGPDTHVDDIVNLLHFEDVRDVVLVGHSYGGMITSSAATLESGRVSDLVYLDAFVPTAPGVPASAMANPERKAEMKAFAALGEHIPPHGFERWARRSETQAWLKRFCTPQPLNCFDKGVSALVDPSDLPVSRHYIWCEEHTPSPFEAFYARYKDDPRWRCHALPCLHDAMIEMPDAVNALLCAIAD